MSPADLNVKLSETVFKEASTFFLTKGCSMETGSNQLTHQTIDQYIQEVRRLKDEKAMIGEGLKEMGMKQ